MLRGSHGGAVLAESLLERIDWSCQAAGRCGTVGAGRDGSDDADQTPGDWHPLGPDRLLFELAAQITSPASDTSPSS